MTSVGNKPDSKQTIPKASGGRKGPVERKSVPLAAADNGGASHTILQAPERIHGCDLSLYLCGGVSKEESLSWWPNVWRPHNWLQESLGSTSKTSLMEGETVSIGRQCCLSWGPRSELPSTVGRNTPH